MSNRLKEMSDYYELYQQCKLERDLLREEIQKRDELLTFSYKVIDSWLNQKAILFDFDKATQWLKQYEELKR